MYRVKATPGLGRMSRRPPKTYTGHPSLITASFSVELCILLKEVFADASDTGILYIRHFHCLDSSRVHSLDSTALPASTGAGRDRDHIYRSATAHHATRR